MFDFIQHVENKYAVEEVIFANEQIWPYLRLSYCLSFTMNKAGHDSSNKGELLKVFNKLKIKNIFFGWANWFRKYDYIVFSDTSERKKIEGRYYNKLVDPIIDIIGRDKVFCIEKPNPDFCQDKLMHTRHYASYDMLHIFTYILRYFIGIIFKHKKICGAEILNRIQLDYDIKLDNRKEIYNFISSSLILKLILLIYSPKAVFVTDHSSYMSLVKSARDLGIIVVEIQHGVIVKYNPAYNFIRAFDKRYYPNCLLSFGDVKRYCTGFNQITSIYPVGSFYIEHIREIHKHDEVLLSLKARYSKIVAITLQWTVEHETLEFIVKAAKLDSRFCYLLIFRYTARPVKYKEYSEAFFPSNIIVIRDKNFYELMNYVDFHSTVYSTCAIEAPSLGVQNVMINISNLSKQFYWDILYEERVTRYANNPEEYVRIIDSFEKIDKNELIQLNEPNFKPGYKENIVNFLKMLNEEIDSCVV